MLPGMENSLGRRGRTLLRVKKHPNNVNIKSPPLVETSLGFLSSAAPPY